MQNSTEHVTACMHMDSGGEWWRTTLPTLFSFPWPVSACLYCLDLFVFISMGNNGMGCMYYVGDNAPLH